MHRTGALPALRASIGQFTSTGLAQPSSVGGGSVQLVNQSTRITSFTYAGDMKVCQFQRDWGALREARMAHHRRRIPSTKGIALARRMVQFETTLNRR
jgi:hypothetical protein